jgi:nondiscriminating glutamyl-tRNA synthetase
MEELIEHFDLTRVSKSGGVFDVDKLNWMNNHYIKETDDDRLTQLALPYLVGSGIIEETEYLQKMDWIKSIVSLVKEKLDYMMQITPYVQEFLKDVVEIDPEADETLQMEHVKALLETFRERILAMDTFEGADIKQVIKSLQKDLGIKGKNLYMPLRIGVTGQMHGSDLIETIRILGKDKVAMRLSGVIEKL